MIEAQEDCFIVTRLLLCAITNNPRIYRPQVMPSPLITRQQLVKFLFTAPHHLSFAYVNVYVVLDDSSFSSFY